MRTVILLILIFAAQIGKAQFNTHIVGKDTACISFSSDYSVDIQTPSNLYLFRDTSAAHTGGNGYFALDAGYSYTSLANTFSYDLWVKPTRTINMFTESNVCSGSVSVPLANSNQNWAIVPLGLSGGEMSVGLTIGTNGLMVGEHSGNIMVSRLSYTTSITDWIHIAIVYRTDSIFLYLNGNLVRSRLTHCPSDTKRVTSGLTGYYYSPDFTGNIDEFRLWDVPLSKTQVQDIMNKKFLNNVEGLRYYASFDNGAFQRTLGDIGSDFMINPDLDEKKYIKPLDLGLNCYTGQNLSSLFPFNSNSFNYLWSTGSTNQTTSFIPTDTVNKIFVTVSNPSISKTDSLLIIGENCCVYYINDTIKVYDTVQVYNNQLQYLRFESYYSADDGQVNVYEIQAYNKGLNVALHKPGYANSYQGGDYSSNGINAVDGDEYSRWSSERNDLGPDSLNPHFIVIDLEQKVSIDSLLLNIKGFDSWNQTFDFSVSSDSINWYSVGKGLNTTGIFKYSPNVPFTAYDTVFTTVFDTLTTHISVYDTIHVTKYDTVFIAVTDTLIIDAVLTGINPPNNVNEIKIFPNPAKDHITIDFGNYSIMTGYSLKITNSSGQQVLITPINQQSSYLNLSDWGGKGLYFVHIIDNLSNTIEIKKIVLQ